MPEAIVNVNGVVSDGDHAVISIFDHGFLYGDGVYETLRTYHRKLFLLEQHLIRLRASASRVSLDIPLSDAALGSRMQETMQAVNPDGEVTIRALITRGIGDLTYHPAACPSPSIVIIARPFRPIAERVLREGVGVMVARAARHDPQRADESLESSSLVKEGRALQ